MKLRVPPSKKVICLQNSHHDVDLILYASYQYTPICIRKFISVKGLGAVFNGILRTMHTKILSA